MQRKKTTDMATIKFILSTKRRGGTDRPEIYCDLRHGAGGAIHLSASTKKLAYRKFWLDELIRAKKAEIVVLNGDGALTEKKARKLDTLQAELKRLEDKAAAGQTHDEPSKINPIVLQELIDLNADLKTLKTELDKRFKSTPLELINAAWLADQIEEVLNPEAKEKREAEEERKREERRREEEAQNAPPTLKQTMRLIIEKGTSRTTPNGRNVSRETVQQFKITADKINAFLKSIGVDDLPLEQVDKSFYDKFRMWLYNYGNNGKPLAKGTVGKQIKHVKTAINDLPAKFRTLCEFVEPRKCVKETEDVDYPALTEDEVQRITDIELTSPAMRVVRDQFLLLVWTGQRYSDLDKLEPRNIVETAGGTKVFKIKQQKTAASVIIPILPQAQAILDKYDNRLPPPYTNQFFNRALEDIAKAAGIDTQVPITRTTVLSPEPADESKKRGRKKKTPQENTPKEHTVYYPKYELIHAHTARRTFATIMYEMGVDAFAIMRITGHKKLEVFLRYVKTDDERNADRMLKRFAEIMQARAPKTEETTGKQRERGK